MRRGLHREKVCVVGQCETMHNMLRFCTINTVLPRCHVPHGASSVPQCSVQCDQCWVLHTWFNIKYPSPREYILYCSALPLWGTRNPEFRWLIIY